MILVCLKWSFFFIGPKRLLWSPHIWASGQTGKLHPHKLDRARRERFLHHLPGLISQHWSHVCGGDGTLRVKGRGRGLYPPPHNRLNLISTMEYPGLCQIYIISAILLFHLELFVVIIVSTYIVCTQMDFFFPFIEVAIFYLNLNKLSCISLYKLLLHYFSP